MAERTDRTPISRKALDELSDRVKPVERDVVGGLLHKDYRGSVNTTTGDCAGAPTNC